MESNSRTAEIIEIIKANKNLKAVEIAIIAGCSAGHISKVASENNLNYKKHRPSKKKADKWNSVSKGKCWTDSMSAY